MSQRQASHDPVQRIREGGPSLGKLLRCDGNNVWWEERLWHLFMLHSPQTRTRLDIHIPSPIPPIHLKIWLFDTLRLLHLSGSGSFQLNHKESETYHSQVQARTKALAQLVLSMGWVRLELSQSSPSSGLSQTQTFYQLVTTGNSFLDNTSRRLSPQTNQLDTSVEEGLVCWTVDI